MTADEARKICEDEDGTAHLPEPVRDCVWQGAYEEGHAYGMGCVMATYPERAERALLIFNAGVASERQRILARIRELGPDFDADAFADGLEAIQ